MRRLTLAGVAACILLTAARPVAAQSPGFEISLAQRPQTPGERLLAPGASASMPPEEWQWMNGELGVRNVSLATLTPFLPPVSGNTGAAVIIAPGGAFLGLSMDTEGYRVARWFADHGVAAFVLKYRTLATPADFSTFRREMIALRTGGGPVSFHPPETTPPEAIADGLAAIRLVRAHAAQWRVDPDRIGMMGFSAGALTTISVAVTGDETARLAFVAPIYGSLDAVTPPRNAPPMYVVLATDDALFWKGSIGLVDSWSKAGAPVEFHLYQTGGHGFGLGRPGTTTTDWIEGFRRWLDSNGFLKTKR